jgi:hypothetical protein
MEPEGAQTGVDDRAAPLRIRRVRVAIHPPDDEREHVVEVLRQLTFAQRAASPAEVTQLRHFFATYVLPHWPTRRVREKHAQHVEDDLQWPDDTSPEEYLESLREAILDARSGIYLVQDEIERTWTIYFVGRVAYRWQGQHAGRRLVILFNAERHFSITGFQAEAGEDYVDRQQGFWALGPR